MKASKFSWLGWLAIAAGFAIAAKLTAVAADYVNHIPGKWGAGDFLYWVAVIILVPGCFSLIAALIRFVNWAWKE